MNSNLGNLQKALLKQRCRWVSRPKAWVPLVLVFAVIAFGVYCSLSPADRIGWTGFKRDIEISTSEKRIVNGVETTKITKDVSGKTLWDWMSVLGVPISLAILGFWFQQQQQARADQEVKLEKEIAEGNQREEALQAYFDRLSTLLVDKNLIAIAARIEREHESVAWIGGNNAQDPEHIPRTELDEQQELLDAAVDVIRARTISILRRLGDDGDRKTSVIRFLLEAEVISKLSLDLSRANLSRVDLSRAYLKRAKLSGVNLSGASLARSDLSGADLRWTDLSFADLNGTVLSRANLRWSNLTACEGWTEDQLGSAKLCRTLLPEGCTLDSNRDCQELEA